MFTAEGFQKTLQYIELFKQGVICTVSLSALTVFFGFIIAMILALLRISKLHPFDYIATAYVEVFRATPMLVQLFLVYYVLFGNISLPQFKIFGFIRFERFLPGVVALAMNSGAYLSEIIRAGIQSVDIGQTEASRSLGMTKGQNMRFVVMPQATKNILPAIGNEFVTIIKESSICYTIGVQDIMYAVNAAKGATYRIAEPLVIASAVYFCLTFTTSKLLGLWERRMKRADR